MEDGTMIEVGVVDEPNELPKSKEIVLTGDRPTGPLHLGHYVGSLKTRVELQQNHPQFILIADSQALTDNIGNTEKIRNNVLEIVKDYLAVGINPNLSDICVQSHIPALYELTILYLNYVTLSRLERNPTIRQEIMSRGFERDIPVGFLTYPVAQAADITAFKASIIPVGDDQLPMIEQANEIVFKINRQSGREILPAVKALVTKHGRLPGYDGKGKMSKSLNNSIPLSASDNDIKAAVKKMFTDPTRTKISDPGHVEGNMVFTYLDVFDTNPSELEQLKADYTKGGIGDGFVKQRLEKILIDLITPIRERRESISGYVRNGDLRDILYCGTEAAIKTTNNTLEQIKDALGITIRI